ncbi:OadG family protein [Ruminiclostridium herbifermentans]|uniref:OadG family protein n=1 Tax=Ruminiclostridium herbifermentans TaxID=2488810 RepID=A0A4U7JDH5_9FIRM|nr:OadG family transporter subunit [Ruminiclostridium herbifermentans]QNU67884.1 OadG family protein [Ruminiclostridium herbifermentans]
MNIIESLVVSIFSIALVFFVLAFLYFLVKILTKLLSSINAKLIESQGNKTSAPDTDTNESTNSIECSSGELKLINVDERTAALIMAIVSDETKIPLSELIFKSIKAVD